jgi:hypothetical protein
MRISWAPGNNQYTSGVSNGVLYPKNSPGVGWTGLVSVTEKGDDSPSFIYVDGQKIRDRLSSSFAGTIEAFTFPDEFEPYLGLVDGITSQVPEPFGFSYRTNHELHIVYSAFVSPSSDDYQTVKTSETALVFAWSFSTLPVPMPVSKPASHIVIDLNNANSGAVSDLEDILYGSDSDDPRLPSPSEVLDLFESHTTLRITDDGDGTWTATGPDSIISVTGDTFTITWPSAVYIDSNTYTIRSL